MVTYTAAYDCLLQCIPRYCFSRKIGMLKRRRYMDHRNLFPVNQFPENMVSHIDMLGVGVGYSVLRELHHTLIILEHRYARHAYIRQHEAPNLPQEQNYLHGVCKHHVLCLRRGECDAFLSPRNQDTQAPPNITNPPETDLLSAALLA